MNAREVLNNIEACIEELESANQNAWIDWTRMAYKGWSNKKVFKIREVCEELSIFDWWNDNLSMSQLKQMRSFVKLAISLGFNGYVCFKVGAAGCSHGMWAYTEESKDGYSPKEGDILFHSFVSGANHYDVEIGGEWMTEKLGKDCDEGTLKDVKQALAQR